MRPFVILIEDRPDFDLLSAGIDLPGTRERGRRPLNRFFLLRQESEIERGLPLAEKK